MGNKFPSPGEIFQDEAKTVRGPAVLRSGYFILTVSSGSFAGGRSLGAY
jgi:hypothetical protein